MNPIPEQIFNCEDAFGNSPMACKRVVLTNGATHDLAIGGIQPDSMYVLYYIPAN